MKQAIIETLCADHRRMDELLGVIDQQVDAMADGKSPDFDLLSDALNYCCSYPSLLHHAYEDAIIARLRQHCDEEPAACLSLNEQHGTLAGLARHLSQLLDRVAEGAEIGRDQVVEPARQFVSLYRDHMAFEENEFFPLAEATLPHGAWQGIAAHLGAQSEEQIKQLRDLRQRIMDWAAA